VSLRRTIGRNATGPSPSSAEVVKHPPLFCCGCGCVIGLSVVIPPGGPGSLTFCQACGQPCRLVGPAWTERASELDLNNATELAAIRLALASQGIQLPRPRAP
jgi:hypothetical protein